MKLLLLVILSFRIRDCHPLSHFENFLLKEKVQRSRFRLNNHRNSSNSASFPDAQSSSVQEELKYRKLYQSSPASTLLAIIHSSEIPWPARVEVLTNVLVTLEGSYDMHGGIKKSGGFELVVVLDSEGELVPRRQCSENHMTMMRTVISQDNRVEQCDSKQLLESASIPFVVASTRELPSSIHSHQKQPPHHHQHISHRRRTSSTNPMHVHPAKALKQYVTESSDQEKWPQSKYQTLWYAAVEHCRKTPNCETVVTMVSSAFIPRGTVNMLAATASKHQGAVLPTFDRKAVNYAQEGNRNTEEGQKVSDDTDNGLFLTVGSHPLETSTHLSVEIKEYIQPFLDHPLNYERVAKSLHAAHHNDGASSSSSHDKAENIKKFGIARKITKDDNHFCNYVSAMFLAAAMPLSLWEKLEHTSPIKGHIPLDDCHLVSKALHEGGASLAVHYGAYLVARPPHRAISLLSNTINTPPDLSIEATKAMTREQSLASKAARASSKAEAKMEALVKSELYGTTATNKRSRTLFTVTCAGIWHRTLSMLLSLEMGEALHLSNKGKRYTGSSSGGGGSDERDNAALLQDEGGFDFMLAVTPRDNDTSYEFARAAGLTTFLQPRAVGLTNLWNLVLQYCIENGYEYCFISNNDVLIGGDSVRAMTEGLATSLDLVIPYTKRGAGTLDLNLYTKQYKGSQFLKYGEFLDPLDGFLESPLSWQRLQKVIASPRGGGVGKKGGGGGGSGYVKIKGWMAFCFGLRADWIQRNYLSDGSKRLWNDTRWMNYAQETHLPIGARMGAAKGAYVHHFRGGTLDSASCKNGFLDCATWQENHRPDTASDWFTPDE